MLQNSFAQHDKPYHGKECSDQTAFISMTTLQGFIYVKIVQHNIQYHRKVLLKINIAFNHRLKFMNELYKLFPYTLTLGEKCYHLLPNCSR